MNGPPIIPPPPDEAAAVHTGLSPWGLFRRRLRRSRAGLAGMIILGLFYLIALFGSFIAPYNVSVPDRVNRRYPLAPPTPIHFRDADGNFHWRPFVHRMRLVDRDRGIYEEDPSVTARIVLFPRGDPYRLWGLIPMDRHLFGIEGTEARLYLLGADPLGRDMLSRLIEGGQVSLTIGLFGIGITLVLGLLVGGIAGHFGGWVDVLLMRLVELLLSIPALYLILALRAALPDDMTSVQRYFIIVGILGLIGWAGAARVIRGMVLSLREREFILASRALGAGHWRLITRHLLPNTFTYVIVAATLAVPGYILGEVGLSYLGFGIDEPSTSWGLMLKAAQDNSTRLATAWWLLLPGVAIFFTVMAFNFLGDGLRDALDPKSKR